MGSTIQPYYARKKCDGCKRVTLVTLLNISGQSRHGHSFMLCDSCMSGDARTYRRYHKYKISPQEYEQMLQEQDGVCAICKKPETGHTGYTHDTKAIAPLSVDHNHITGRVRSLLCRKCNAALGMLDEDPERMEALARYIRKHKE